ALLSGLMSLSQVATCVEADDDTSDITEVDQIVIGSPDLKTEEERQARDMCAPPGFSFASSRDEESLEVIFGSENLGGFARDVTHLNAIIATRRRRFRRVRAKHLHLTMINLSIFPFKKIEEILANTVIEQITITVRGEMNFSLLDFIRRKQGKDINLIMEDRPLDTQTLLNLPPLTSLNAAWLSGFRGAWEEENGLSERDFVELVRKRHAWVHMPVNIVDEVVILEVIKIVSASDTNQRVTLRIRTPLFDRFFTLVGLLRTPDRIVEIWPTEFVIVDGTTILYGHAKISISRCLTRRTYGPGSIPYYQISIDRSL
ncbi:hypothetical protein PENTCL1PPCAC_9847, partial [Pristionchus entomophagus]